MRHPPLDDETRVTIVEALRRGHFLETAAALAGCTTAQVRRWLRLGAQEDSEFHRFAVEARIAVAESEDAIIGLLRGAAEAGDLKAVTWYLERRHPERWGAKVQHIVTQEVDAILERIESLEAELGPETVNRVLGAVAGEWGSGEGTTEEEAGESLH